MKKSELRALIKEELKGLQELDLSPAVPEDTSYTEFAKAVAQMIKDEYGSHNVEDFMKVLHAELGLSEAKAEGAMSAEEEDMIDDYEEKEANKYALDKEEPLEETSGTYPDDVQWEVADVLGAIDPPYTYDVTLTGYSEMTGKEYKATGVATRTGAGGDWDIDDIYEVEEDLVTEVNRIVEAWKARK